MHNNIRVTRRQEAICAAIVVSVVFLVPAIICLTIKKDDKSDGKIDPLIIYGVVFGVLTSIVCCLNKALRNLDASSERAALLANYPSTASGSPSASNNASFFSEGNQALPNLPQFPDEAELEGLPGQAP